PLYRLPGQHASGGNTHYRLALTSKGMSGNTAESPAANCTYGIVTRIVLDSYIVYPRNNAI
ncbi:hypothetical protein, partial [Enterobacter hormaechei]|uniref:hypothetical protein n=1 Tax=Enterobacter hormaechei TaxID=158836 RepID=UPI00203D1FB6